MGNAASNNAQGRPIPGAARRRESFSPHRRAQNQHYSAHHTYTNQPSQSSSTASTNVHPSLRTKKKSLELPDLASLAFTQASSNGRKPPQHSSPIAIPVSPNVGTNSRRRPQNYPSAQQIADPDEDYDLETHHTHIPVQYNHHQHQQQQQPGANQGRDNASQQQKRQSRGRQPRGVDDHRDRDRDRERDARGKPLQVQEVVYSTIPIALGQPIESGLASIEEVASGVPGMGDGVGSLIPSRKSTSDEPVDVKISWNSGGTHVLLARAGDDDWQGRQVMHRESPQSNTFSVHVSLHPGTHHFRFIVDDQWRVAEDLPAAVDDQGTLANYVNVNVSVFTPTLGPHNTPPKQSSTGAIPTSIALPPPLSPSAHANANVQPFRAPGQSFWSTSSSVDDQAQPSQYVPLTHPPPPPRWTSDYPPELLEAAREEEAYLNATGPGGGRGIPEPNIPPAPTLPRHLEKLILNVRSPGVVVPRSGGSPVAGSSSRGSRGRERSSSAATPRKTAAAPAGRSTLGMTSASGASGAAEGKLDGAIGGVMPVTTASGTDVSRVGTSPGAGAGEGGAGEDRDREKEKEKEKEREKEKEKAMLDGPAIADDNSMLPVPNHVVLHHLSTSAIKNGVLAVGVTTRYKKKYLTTIYYKPT